MEIKEWRSLTMKAIGLLAVILLIGILGETAEHNVAEPAVGKSDVSQELLETKVSNVEKIEVQLITQEKPERPGKRCIEIKKIATGQSIQAGLENDYMNASLRLNLTGKTADSYGKKDVVRWFGKHSYTGKYQEGHDTVKGMEVFTERDRSCIRMKMNGIYEASLLETETAWYIVLEKPWEVYDHVIVIDAGHGGDDEGTGSVGWRYREKEYALRVAICLKEILDGTTIKTYYTRLEDVDVPKSERVRLASAVHADLMVSIHCNASEQTETTANGVEALYSTAPRTARESLTSKQLAKNILEQVCEQTGRARRKVIRRDDLYLMHHARVPVTIIEIGYMTNESDMKYMRSEENQKEIARGIYLGIIKSV